MPRFDSLRCCLIVLFCLLVPSALVAEDMNAGDKNKDKSGPDADSASCEAAQPAKEILDYAMYDRMREEGLHHSHVMEFASALMDGIGPRLTGSPNVKHANEWTRDQVTAMGCVHA